MSAEGRVLGRRGRAETSLQLQGVKAERGGLEAGGPGCKQSTWTNL